MGNLDFLEKKPRIAYTLSWDGITDGKVTNTQAMRKVYKISSEEFIPRPDIVWTPTGSSGRSCNTPENIRLEKNYRFRNIEDVSNVSVSVLKENTSTAGYYRFDLFFGDDDNYVELYYVLVANKEIISGDFGNVNPIFPETGWYFSGDSNTEAGDIMSVLKDPLVKFSYSGKGFTSPQKPYSYISRSVEPDDDICVWINKARIPELIDEEFVKGFNAFCNPGDFDSIAEIKLDENLANICKHAARQCLAIRTKNRGGTDYYYYNVEVGASSDDTFIYYNVSYATKGPDNNKVSGLCIELGGSPVYFNPNVTSDEYDEWHDKYIATEP